MSTLFEVLYRAPGGPAREARLAAAVRPLAGELTFREPPAGGSGPVTLTFEYRDRASAEAAAALFRAQGEHVEGPGDYGD